MDEGRQSIGRLPLRRDPAHPESINPRGAIPMTRVLILVAALALIAAACSTVTDDDHSAETTTTAAAATTGAPTTTVTTTTTVAPTTGTAESGQANADENSAADDADRVVDVVMTDFAFDADAFDFEFTPGETVEFAVVNAGVVLHEFRLSNEHRIEEHMADGHDDHDEDSETAEPDGHHENGDVVLTLEAGESGTMVVTFPDDVETFTQVACLLPGHYEAGMYSELAYSA